MSTLFLVLAMSLFGAQCATSPAELDECGVPEGEFAASLLPPSEQGFRDPVAWTTPATTPTLTVTHHVGIGGVRIVRTKGAWPAELHVVFDGFLGLEGMSIAAIDVSGTQVGSQEPQSRTGRTEVDVDEDGNVRVSAGEAFTATLGPANLPPTACELWLGWIDFYRD